MASKTMMKQSGVSKKNKAYKFVREYEKNKKRISEFMEGDKRIEVR